MYRHLCLTFDEHSVMGLRVLNGVVLCGRVPCAITWTVLSWELNKKVVGDGSLRSEVGNFLFIE